MNILIIVKSSANAGISVKALVNSGAQGKFIDQFLVRRLGLRERPLAHSIPVYNIDGTSNRIGSIRNYVEPDMVINGKANEGKSLCDPSRKTRDDPRLRLAGEIQPINKLEEGGARLHS